MELDTSGPQAHVDWRRLHALGLPSGSIRALLALLIFATTWSLLVLRPSREVPDYLRDLLFIIMGHYFAARRRSDQGDEPGPPPLYLPRGSVRLILIAGSAAVALVLFQRGQLTTPRSNPGVVTLLLVGGFLLGVVLNAVSDALSERGYRPPRLAEDLRALVSLAAALILVVLVLNRLLLFFPQERIDAILSPWVLIDRYGPEHVLAAVVGFYFGSRS
jgi:hypothetical protein